MDIVIKGFKSNRIFCMNSNTISSLNQRTARALIYSGAVFFLPVQYNLPTPTRFLIRKDRSGHLQPTDQAKVRLGNVWLNEKTKRYFGSSEKEMLLKGKVRPFLVVRKFRLKRALDRSPYVVGLPITSLKEDKISPVIMQRLKDAVVPQLHYLPPERNQESGLYKPSMVVIAHPMPIPTKYFTHYMGCIHPKDLKIVLTKLKSFIPDAGGTVSGQGGHNE
jgi:hypothetical protein